MKRILALVVFLIPFLAMAQTNGDLIVKTITVTGTAEREIVPDQIYFNVVLKEYMKDKSKIGMEKIEKDFMKAIQDAGIPITDVTIEQVYGQRWRQKRKSDAEFLSSKSFLVKVSNPNIMDDVMDKVNPEAIENVEISHYDHSKMTEFKKELKIEAVKAAKEKAGYLLGAINEQLGEAIEVSEYDISYGPVYNNFANVRAQVSYDAVYEGGESYPQAGFKKIKISYSVTVKFRIK